MLMSDDLRLFDAVVDQALSEPLDSLMAKYAAAVERGDLDQVQLLDDMLCLAIVLGNHANTGEAEPHMMWFYAAPLCFSDRHATASRFRVVAQSRKYRLMSV